MVNEDILTALRNAIEHGESLQSASDILINSGYNAKEVKEASVYIGTGVIIQEKPNQLLMPANKPAVYNPRIQQSPAQQIQNPIPSKPNYTSKDIMQIKQEISSPLMPAPDPRYQQAFTYQQPSAHNAPQPSLSQSYPSSSYYSQQSLSSQLNEISSKKTYTKEIILLMILLILIAILIGTIIFRNEIINFFTQMFSDL